MCLCERNIRKRREIVYTICSTKPYIVLHNFMKIIPIAVLNTNAAILTHAVFILRRKRKQITIIQQYRIICGSLRINLL